MYWDWFYANLAAHEWARIPAVFRSRFARELRSGMTASDVEVYIRYFPSDRTFARRTERTREEGGNGGNRRSNCGKATSLASLSAARDAKWRSHWIPWDKGSRTERGDLFHDRAWIASSPLWTRARPRQDLIIKLNSNQFNLTIIQK